MIDLPFVKMEGAGNDYVFVDGHAREIADDASELAAFLADRNFGIGGDGLIVLDRSERHDCRMRMWNADGSRGAMCGNGLRCLAVLARNLDRVDRDDMVVETDAGPRRVTLLRDASGEVRAARAEMGEASVDARATEVVIEGSTWACHPGDAGNPHAVIFCDGDLDDIPVLQVGQAFQRLPAFPDGVNVEFVHVDPDGALSQRTFERGSGETLACGTGATVAALAAMETGRVPGPIVTVRLRGGELEIERTGSLLVMQGPARTVFEGKVAVPERLLHA